MQSARFQRVRRSGVLDQEAIKATVRAGRTSGRPDGRESRGPEGDGGDTHREMRHQVLSIQNWTRHNPNRDETAHRKIRKERTECDTYRAVDLAVSKSGVKGPKCDPI